MGFNLAFKGLKLSFESLHFSSFVAYTFKTMILCEQNLTTIYDILSLTNASLVTSVTILCSTINAV